MSIELKQRAKLIAFGLLILLLGGGLLAGGVDDMSILVEGLHDHRPVIVSEPRAAAELIAGVLALTIAVLFLILRPAKTAPLRRERRRDPREHRAERWVGRYLVFLFAGILCTLFAPLMQRLVVISIVTARGYVHCPDITWPRHQPDRWARPDSVDACPREGASPNS